MIVEVTKKRGRHLGWQENYIGWLYCLPIIIGILAFTLLPILLSIYSMFVDWSGGTSVLDAKFVGMQNFKTIFSGSYKKTFWPALGNTFFMMLNLPVSMFLGVLLALAMNRKMPGAKVFRVLYYVPCITSVVAVTILFQKMFSTTGVINTLFGRLDNPIQWLTDDVLVKVTVIIFCVWKGVGYSTLMYLAGLQSVSTDQIEAAKMDGADSKKIFFKITIPALYPITFYLLVTGVMGGLQIFNEPYILAGYGRGDNAMTNASLIYRFFKPERGGTPHAGLAAVAAWALALLVFIVTAIQMVVDNKKEKY